jgi:hypothetical protein
MTDKFKLAVKKLLRDTGCRFERWRRGDQRLSEGGVFTEEQARRIATTLADHLRDELATKHDLLVLKAELEAKLTAGPASVRNQLLTAQVAAFFGIILYITFKL